VVSLVSEALANRVWQHDDPVGRRIGFGVDVPNNDEPWLTIVGVVADVKAVDSKSPMHSLEVIQFWQVTVDTARKWRDVKWFEPSLLRGLSAAPA
jgi:hypothetical protein